MKVELKNIHFSYGPVKALNGINLVLNEGATGLLGPNGAGKSTLLKIMLGFLTPDEGDGQVLGYDLRREQKFIRQRVGYMPEDDCYITGMDGVSFTAYMGELSGMPRQEAMKRAHEVLFYVGLGESRYRLVETYSSGMRQRLKLAQALVHDPKLLFLDEPTANLDPAGRQDILELIGEIASSKDISVLLCSHLLDDIESICTDMVIINKGQIAASGRIEDLKMVDYRLYELKIKGELPVFSRELEEAGCRLEETEDRLIKIYTPPDFDQMEIFRAAARNGVQVRQFARSQSRLEDLFARVVGVD
ncbi:MAG TPA: ABC transporter ATP-binding protein [Candidatus Saccharicenans sp.]|jgi:ABC-2 type transport system ATP-binding protein|nr:ABC transporter ATP-binding protein [Candidatus Saccharicenans sp.]HOL44846.1 ABC transporter ATP-binding protein [Candidatus Saccharicenans sp.]HOM94164.1 ABC transporter ATP-binding protein [Candidatus Saccharicenans sp.]HOP60868.1 ABC transporter ATP-binding protein [Candidatus Saccharicenans sp.]HOT68662.1 ABC transporter ATP-binding protein [Candidatus Saccharicenans sp.]